MKAEVLIENRKLKRLIINVKIYERKTGEFIGYSANMHVQGMMMSSTGIMPVGEEYLIQIKHMEDDEVIEIPLHMRCLWSSPGDNPDFFQSGYVFIEPKPAQTRAIENLLEDLAI